MRNPNNVEKKEPTFDNAVQLLAEVQIPGKQKHTESWNEFQQLLTERKRKHLRTTTLRAAAAVLIFAFSIVGIIGYRAEQQIACAKGESKMHELPDGSKVFMNCESELRYNTFLWNFQRKLSFAGQAYFEVAKGETFTVKSPTGTTQVLGTTFTIFARTETYRVSCFSGKVAVTTKVSGLQLLEKGEELLVQGNVPARLSVEDKNKVNDWMLNEFRFDNKLSEVLAELERRYDYTIVNESSLKNEHYTAFFKQYEIEKVTQIICASFGLEFNIDSTKREIRIYDAPQR